MELGCFVAILAVLVVVAFVIAMKANNRIGALLAEVERQQRTLEYLGKRLSDLRKEFEQWRSGEHRPTRAILCGPGLEEEEPPLRSLHRFPIQMLHLSGLDFRGVDHGAAQRMHTVAVVRVKFERDRALLAAAGIQPNADP